MEPSNQTPSKKSEKDPIPSLIAAAKRLGISFDELSVMSLRTLLDIFEASTVSEEENVREATQADIDRLA